MLEAVVEGRLKRLMRYGFAVFKLRTPGHSGVMDRMILWPAYCPGAPIFVELKAPGKDLRALQAGVEREWKRRGCDVRQYCDTVEKVDNLIDELVSVVKPVWEKEVYGS